jgi:branched-chain amino acid transport system substrate-binding protein
MKTASAKRILAAIALTAGALLAGAASAQTLKIGIIAPLTGPAAPWGLAISEGAKILARDYNAKGGLQIGGKTYQVEIVSYDDHYKAQDSISAYQRLVTRDGVKYIAIAAGVSTLAIKPNIEDDKVVVMTAGYLANLLDPNSKHMYRMWGIPADYYPGIYRWLKDNTKERRAVILGPDDESQREMVSLTNKLLKDHGYTILATEMYDKSLKDFLPLLTKVLAQKPDIIDLGGTAPATAAVLVRQAREFGYKGLFFIPGSSAWREVLDGAGPAAAEGVLNMVYVDPANEAYKRFAGEYRKAVNQEPNESLAPYSDGVNILIQSIVKSGSVEDTSKFEEGFRKALPMKSIQGDMLTIGGGMAHGIDHQVAAFRYIGVIKNGQLQVVGKIQ